MRKMFLSLAACMFLLPSVMAGNTVSIRVSFTIPERIEIKTPCDGKAKQEKAWIEQETDFAKNTIQQQLAVRNDKICLVKTIAAK